MVFFFFFLLAFWLFGFVTLCDSVFVTLSLVLEREREREREREFVKIREYINVVFVYLFVIDW